MQALAEVPHPQHGLAPTLHIAELQSVRGLAALAVLLHHCLFYYTYDPGVKRCAEVLINAHAAVVLFYVLSGYVLYGAIQRGGLAASQVACFYVRRLFRIYPALWLAAALGLAYVLVFAGRPLPAPVSDWFPPHYRDPGSPTLKQILGFAAASQALPLPVWSIAVELAGSALMPLLVLLTRKPLAFVAAAALLLGWSFAGGMELPMHVGGYLADFALGAAIARWGVPGLAGSRFAALAVPLGLAALVGLNFARQLGGWDYASAYHGPWPALIEGFFAGGLILAIAAGPVRFGLLRRAKLIWLGDISYSTYILHLPLLAWIAALGGEVLALPLLGSANGLVATLGLLSTVPLATLLLGAWSYRRIELPAIGLGRAVASGIAGAPLWRRTGMAS